ncbi:hypothetical protein NUV25_13240 [Burkholderia pseudomultivorans]|uniref:hypothetical protein n=1 Tax=Burkholderia pseudomultivorans TaxID=1207504 RepID=UPI0028765311|nr:hypothetical protein [Burkholderia pseudomultivorans]MDS0858670.1 hypothetical protein [Burkholderia pseudomultivorans]
MIETRGSDTTSLSDGKPPTMSRTNVNPVVHQDCFTEGTPFLGASRRLCAMQALVRTGQLLGYGPMYVYAKTLAESPDT